ncbi:MAG: hypothetical protein V4539_13590 [Bacteroidota bacterium]
MKTSNKILLSLLAVMVLATVLNDLSLKKAYSRIKLNDPFKNYQPVLVEPFKHLQIKGGNGYTIEIKQASALDVKVMSSRKNFLTTSSVGDTLFIVFTVSGSISALEPAQLPVGLIISSPFVRSITADGTSTIINNWKTDSLQVAITGNASVNINDVAIGSLTLSGSEHSLFNFHHGNKINALAIRLQNNAAVFLKDVTYASLNPNLTDNSTLVFSAQSAAQQFAVKK